MNGPKDEAAKHTGFSGRAAGERGREQHLAGYAWPRASVKRTILGRSIPGFHFSRARVCGSVSVSDLFRKKQQQQSDRARGWDCSSSQCLIP